MLGDTPTAERAKLIDQFQDRTVRALINVAVATEGFDLPEVFVTVLDRQLDQEGVYTSEREADMVHSQGALTLTKGVRTAGPDLSLPSFLSN